MRTETVVVHDPVLTPLAPSLTTPATIPLLPDRPSMNADYAAMIVRLYSAIGIDTCKLYRISALQPKSTTIVPAWCGK